MRGRTAAGRKAIKKTASKDAVFCRAWAVPGLRGRGPSLLHGHQLVIHVADADLPGMLDLAAPVGLGMDVGEVVVVLVGALTQHAGADGGRGVDRVDTGVVQGHGSKPANMPMSGTTAASFSAWQSQ